MSSSLPLFPPSASSVATEMDLLYLFITAVCAFFTIVVTALVVYFTVKYKRQRDTDVGADIHGSLVLELTWTVIPFILSLIMFGWGASLFYRLSKPPSDSMEITVVGKQWMWKIQHPEGVREINELHVPLGRNIRLTMGSEDVIHDFAIPAFRTKMDVVPGKFTTMWFQATQLGTFTIFCDQYCGTKHSGMIGQVVVMLPQDYEAWLVGGRSTGSTAQTGRTALHGPLVHHLPQDGLDRPRAVAHRPLRQHRAAHGRPQGRSRRELPARVDHEFAGQDRAGLPADHAGVPDADQ